MVQPAALSNTPPTRGREATSPRCSRSGGCRRRLQLARLTSITQAAAFRLCHSLTWRMLPALLLAPQGTQVPSQALADPTRVARPSDGAFRQLAQPPPADAAGSPAGTTAIVRAVVIVPCSHVRPTVPVLPRVGAITTAGQSTAAVSRAAVWNRPVVSSAPYLVGEGGTGQCLASLAHAGAPSALAQLFQFASDRARTAPPARLCAFRSSRRSAVPSECAAQRSARHSACFGARPAGAEPTLLG